MSWLTANPALAWLALALVLAAVEVATLDLFFAMLAAGALAAALAAALGGGLVVQVVTAVVVALLLLGLLRPLLVRRLHAGDPTLTGAAALIGREARVVETVTDTGGRVKILGEVWSARTGGSDLTDSILPGQPVRVIAIEGATAVVAGTSPESETIA